MILRILVKNSTCDMALFSEQTVQYSISPWGGAYNQSLTRQNAGRDKHVTSGFPYRISCYRVENSGFITSTIDSKHVGSQYVSRFGESHRHVAFLRTTSLGTPPPARFVSDTASSEWHQTPDPGPKIVRGLQAGAHTEQNMAKSDGIQIDLNR